MVSMKKVQMKILLAGALMLTSLLSCKFPNSKNTLQGTTAQAGSSVQEFELIIDGVKKSLDKTPLIVPIAVYGKSIFNLSYLSEKDDIQFNIKAYIPELKTGSIQVYDDASAVSEYNENMPDAHYQTAFLAPYPKNPMPPISLSRAAYFAPKLGLKPLTLNITSITDERMEGDVYPSSGSKRIKGTFSGVLAYVERQEGGYEYHVVKTTQVEGIFDVFCRVL
jgi:hypothetical protein